MLDESLNNLRREDTELTIPIHSILGMLVAYFLSFFPWWVVTPIAYLSHYILDFCPHWEKDLSFFSSNKRWLQIATLIELLLAVGLYVFARWQGWDDFSFLAAAIAAGLPDVPHLHRSLGFLSLNGWHNKVHRWWQGNPKKENDGGPCFQVAFILVFVLLVSLF